MMLVVAQSIKALFKLDSHSGRTVNLLIALIFNKV